jgi:cardiolipin synthase
MSTSPDNNWDSEQLFDDASAYFNTLIDDINNAQHSIRLESYIFDWDKVGKRILAALNEAANRGVNVMLLVDGIGSMMSLEWLIQHAAQHRIQLRIYHPPPWFLRSHALALSQLPALPKVFYFLARLNQRDHRKLCVIDHHTAWVGSFNVSAVHLPHRLGGQSWRDYGVRVSGQAVERLAENFDHLWLQRQPVQQSGHLKHYISNLSPITRRLRQQFLLDLINGANRRLWITNAYFSPSKSILKAIKRACRRGVDVRLIVAEQSDVPLFPDLTATYYSDLLRYGVEVYAYQKSILHAKVMLVDQRAIIGSTNFNHRSFLHDLELDLLLTETATLRKLEQYFHADTRNSHHLNGSDNPRYIRSRLMGWLPRLFRYWL